MISVAIDGPSGAGKSSLAKRLAKDLGYVYVDTGAMYRSIGLYAVRAGVDPKDEAAVTALLPQIKLAIRLVDGAQHIYLNGEDVSDAIRAENIGMAASAVSAHPPVRAFLLDMQRELAASSNVIMDGRDIGTVVLPEAQVKIFLTASVEARAKRRLPAVQSVFRNGALQAAVRPRIGAAALHQHLQRRVAGAASLRLAHASTCTG